MATSMSIEAGAPYVYPSFGDRLGGRVLDTILHYVVGFAVVIFIGIVAAVVQALGGPSVDETIARMDGEGAWPFITGLLGIVLYGTLCEGLFGSTPGKYILGMVVLNEDGTRCTLTAAFKRSLALFVDTLFFGVIAWSAMKESPKKQRVGDKWAKTIVVKRASVPQGMLHRPLRFAVVLLVALAADGIIVGVGMLL